MNESDETNKNISLGFFLDCSQIVFTLDHQVKKILWKKFKKKKKKKKELICDKRRKEKWTGDLSYPVIEWKLFSKNKTKV